ncbi:hypothetical protein V6D40_04180 [Corynebacterium sp. Q4381]|uniref:hypothetical protein n=1 Tax=Corynebacterium sp. Marseille-Q4381 TaxID=3121597 RepID=UPI002FE636AB
MDVFNFVVAEGRVIDAPRYARALRDLGVSQKELQRLRIQLADVAGTRRGVLEITGGTASLALRPLAPAPVEITVAAEPVADERTQPTRTGPDYGWQQSTLAALPAQEGLLIDAAGSILSAIMHPLAVIERGAVRVSTHPHSPRSVALASVLDILASRGADIVEEPRGFVVGELRDNEVWVIDPVYGVRLVETWLEYGTPRPARLLFDRGGLPSHREVNETRKLLAERV